MLIANSQTGVQSQGRNWRHLFGALILGRTETMRVAFRSIRNMKAALGSPDAAG